MTTTVSNLWGNIVSSVGVFVVTAGLVATWVNQRVTPIEQRIDAIDRRIEMDEQKLTPIVTLEAKEIAIRRDIDSKLGTELFKNSHEALIKQVEDNKTNMIRLIDELAHQIHTLEQKIVSRDENKEHWDIEQTNKLDTNKRIADLTSDFERRIADLTARINALPASSNSAPPPSPR